MSLTSNLKQSFSSKIRSRGQSYYHDGLVSIVEGDHLQVQATVLETGAYDVILDRTDSAVKVSCTCPYYTDYVTTCKHIWATLLEAEEQGFMRWEFDVEAVLPAPNAQGLVPLLQLSGCIDEELDQ